MLIIIIIGSNQQKNNMGNRTHIFVQGLVQGVYFRHHTAVEARRLNLTGWVQNLSDGRVEVLCEGPRESLLQMIEWLKIGPATAHVKGLEVLWEGDTGEFEAFTVRY
jgi:acylphosphatase